VENEDGGTATPLVFSEDFEAFGDSSRWRDGLEFTVQRDIVASGEFAARLTTSGGNPEYSQRRLSSPYDQLYVRLQFQVLETGPRPITLFHLRTGELDPVVAIRIDPSAQISYLTGATGIISTSDSTVSLNEWHTLQVMADTSSTGTSLRIWVDETELTTMNQSPWLGESAMQVLELGDNSSAQYSDIAFDNILVDDAFIPSTQTADPVAGTLIVRTIPVWAGIEFELDGAIFKSNSEGVVRIEVERWSPDLRRRINVHNSVRGNSRVTFTGWRDWLSPHSRNVYATFAQWEPVGFSFVDTNGAPVDVSSIDKVVIKNNLGEIFNLTTADLTGSTLLVTNVVSGPDGIRNKAVTYYLDEVIIDGANVVNRSQQSMTFDANRQWQVSLLFYGVKFQAVDSLFGSPLGDELLIRAPDGTEKRYDLDADGSVTIPRLPRGDYEVSILGGGYSPPRPIRISRDQIVELEVISRADVTLLGGVVGVVVVGLVVAGRPFIVTRPIAYLADALSPLRHAREGKS